MAQQVQGMSSEPNPKTGSNEPMAYQIRLKGHLGREWADWFGGMTITLEGDGNTLLTGLVVDQAALPGENMMKNTISEISSLETVRTFFKTGT
jgi:hypothetical protein